MPREPRRATFDGLFQSVVNEYLKSTKFKDTLTPGTQDHYRRYLTLVAQKDHLGGVAVKVLRPSLVQDYLDEFADQPGKQKNILAALTAVQKWARVRDKLPWPITEGVECVETDGGHHPWREDQIALALDKAREDLARVITLMAYTGQRGSDIVKMRWSDIEAIDGLQGINVTQRKTGIKLWIPLEPELATAMATWERKPPFFLVLNPNDGQSYSREILSWHWNKQRDKRPDLKPLAGLTLHGLRAYRVVTLRKRGHTELEIENMVGMSAPMVKRYCRFADQRALATAAFYRLSPAAKNDSRTAIETSAEPVAAFGNKIK